MPLALLLAMQASGMVVDWLGKRDQIRLGKLGNQVDQASINANIASSRLETEDASLQAMKNLRMNLGTQAAMMAARGIRSGQGNAVLFGNESTANFNADERIRKINQAGNEAALKAGSMMANFHQKASESQNWNQFRTNTINKIPTDLDSWNKLSEGFSKKNNYGFGLSKVGT